jgi:hypothetical protein
VRARQPPRQFVEALRHQLGQDALAVGEVVVRRLVCDASAARHLAQAQRSGALFVQQCARRVQDALAQVGGIGRDGAAGGHEGEADQARVDDPGKLLDSV